MKLNLFQRIAIKKLFGKQWVEPIEKFLSLFDTPERAIASMIPLSGSFTYDGPMPSDLYVGANTKDTPNVVVGQVKRSWNLAPEPPMEHKVGGSTTESGGTVRLGGKEIHVSGEGYGHLQVPDLMAGSPYGTDAGGQPLPASDMTTTRAGETVNGIPIVPPGYVMIDPPVKMNWDGSWSRDWGRVEGQGPILGPQGQPIPKASEQAKQGDPQPSVDDKPRTIPYTDPLTGVEYASYAEYMARAPQVRYPD